jgi:hypothetical protein
LLKVLNPKEKRKQSPSSNLGNFIVLKCVARQKKTKNAKNAVHTYLAGTG